MSILHGLRCSGYPMVPDSVADIHANISRTSHLTFNLGRYGIIRQQSSQVAVAVVTAVGTVVVVVVDVNVAGRNLRWGKTTSSVP